LKESGDDKIMYIRGLGKPDTDFLKNVLELKNFESESVKGGDIFEALESTIETMNDYVGTKKYEKKIFLMTTGAGKTTYTE
jgi:ATP-dependent DNA helicase 2 subunit 2